MAYACKTSCSRNIIGVVPYMPYSKQCKMRKRGSIVCKLMATLLGKSGRLLIKLFHFSFSYLFMSYIYIGQFVREFLTYWYNFKLCLICSITALTESQLGLFPFQNKMCIPLINHHYQCLEAVLLVESMSSRT